MRRDWHAELCELGTVIVDAEAAERELERWDRITRYRCPVNPEPHSRAEHEAHEGERQEGDL
jgi:hypothetical protein